MRNLLLVAGVAGILGVPFGCGGDDKPPAVDGTAAKNTGGNKNTGGKSGSDAAGAGGVDESGGSAGEGSGGEGGEGEIPVGAAPTVTVLSPSEVTDPVAGEVIVGDSVMVTCRAVPGDGPDATPVDPATVKVAVLDAMGAVVAEKDAASTATVGEFAGEVPLTSVPTGSVGFRCSAESLGNALGSDEVTTFVDHGPKLTLDHPVDGAQVGLKDVLQVTFRAEPVPLAAGDTEADVASVELLIAGVPCPTTPVSGSPGEYAATVNLNGPSFSPKPNGNVPLVLKATNERTSVAATALQEHQIFVDGAGPLITTMTADGTVVGGPVKLEFSVSDAGSGVNADSVTVTLNTEEFVFSPTDPAWDHTAGTDLFSFEFDSRNVENSIVQMTVKLEASDNVNNTALEKTFVLYLDHQPPKVDLDPRLIRVKKLLDPFHCSQAFDPVGSDAANDLDQASGYDMFRALVWEQTNFIQGSPAALHYAGTDPNSVRLYFHAPGNPSALLVNKDTPGSGACNEIGYQVRVLTLTALPLTGTSAGSPFYTVADSDPLAPACTPFATSAPTPPAKLCGGVSSMSYILNKVDGQLAEGAIYAHDPSAGVECDGAAWEYRPFLNAADEDGWVCLAARAADRSGNVGVSPPLRLCVDPDLNDADLPNCMTMSTPPPSCTDGCTPPERGGFFTVLR